MLNTTSWTPNSGVTNHTGQTILENSNFFAMPPIEIGQIISAESTLTGKKTSLTILKFLATRGLWWNFAITLVILLVLSTPLTIFFPALIIFVIYDFNQANRPNCSYVGENGFARFTAKRKRLSHPKSTIFCFQDDMAMYTNRTNFIVNGHYTHTEYSFIWRRDRKELHKFNGRFNRNKNLPTDYPFFLACAVETAWIYYLQRKIPTQLDIAGYVEFPAEGRFKAIRIGSGFVEFVSNKGELQRLLESEIKTIRQYSGSIKFIPHDLQRAWVINKYNFQYGSIANFQLFIPLIKNLTKIQIN